MTKHVRFLFAALMALSVLSVPVAAQDLQLHSLFEEHAVLQRDTPLQIGGTGAAGETITVELAGTVSKATVDPRGHWSVRLSALQAGGPYTMRVTSSGGASREVADILIGDVFLCSGQSNMELQVNRTLNAPSEIRAASNDRIRMIQISKATSASPLDALTTPDAWETASSETVPDWSAVCYYYGRELERHLDIPIGLINSSWGGSDIRAWMSAEALSKVGGYDEELALLRLYASDPAAAQRGFGQRWESWWRDRAGTEPWQINVGMDWETAPAKLGDWKTWKIPELADHHGMVWHRGTFELTSAQTGKEAILSLGGVDEVDQTWINGRALGNTFGWGTDRTYAVPAGYLKEGENVVVVNVLNTWGSGGMLGSPRLLISGEELPIGPWRYRKVPASVGYPPRTPWESVAGRTTIHNAMVAPLGNYGLKGVLWYQGETNTGEPKSYKALLESLVAQWRDQFGPELPVLVVQLANYGRPPTTPQESGWAELREAQRLATLEDKHAGLAVAIDVGDVYDIHPANKQEVARRLFRAARSVIYGEEVYPSGPVPVAAVRQGNSVVVSFNDVEDSLVAYSHSAPVGFELCGHERGSCRYASARIEGDHVILEPAGEATRVRYCWADSPICTLYDQSRLPAGPFEISVTR